jgi:signal transduction histidine kinase/FixJ family two-component response regulator
VSTPNYGRTVAVVDDDHRIRESLDSLLSAAGYRVLLFDSGENFLQDEGFANASCLISDIRMPGVDGFELYRRVLVEHPNLPVILISGHRNLQTSEQSIINSVFAYFDKPFDDKGLMTAVRAAVDQSSRSGFTCLEYRSKIMNLMQTPSRSADASLSGRFALQTVPGRMFKMNGMVGGPVNSKGKRGRRSPNDLAGRTTESNCVLPNIAVLHAELKRTRDMLRECEALANIGRMAHHIAHDLRHYLTTIYANVEFMTSTKVDRNDRVEMAAEVREAVADMTGMLDSILPRRSNNPRNNLRNGSLSTIIEQSVQMVRFHPEGKNVELLLGDIPPFDGHLDAVKLGRGIYNLVLNACQATKPLNTSRRVIVRTSSDEIFVTIRVIDNGPGVSASIRESLFPRSVPTENRNGLGLGLAIAEQAAAGHGGFVCLEESRPGRTVFALHISVDQRQSQRVCS